MQILLIYLIKINFAIKVYVKLTIIQLDNIYFQLFALIIYIYIHCMQNVKRVMWKYEKILSLSKIDCAIEKEILKSIRKGFEVCNIAYWHKCLWHDSIRILFDK